MEDNSELNNLLSFFSQRIYGTAFNLIQADPHQWSTRSCKTCRTISIIINKDFGCVLYTKQHSKVK